MAQSNNTVTSPGAGGDTITTVDQTNFSAYPSTGKIPTGVIYCSLNTSTIPTPAVLTNPLYCGLSDGTTGVTVDASSHGLKVYIAGGSIPAGSNLIGAVEVQDGSGHIQPTGDAVSRAIYTFVTNGTNTQGVGHGTEAYTSGTGSATASVATGAANTVVKASAGRLCRVLVTTAGTGSGDVLIYDNATTNSGTVIGIVPATIAIGTYYTFDIPAANGITVANVANGPVLTVSYF